MVFKENHSASLVLPSEAVTSRQAAKSVWEMNASIYFYSREFLMSNPTELWNGKPHCFDMPAYSGFDIDEEHDVKIVEAMMKGYYLR